MAVNMRVAEVVLRCCRTLVSMPPSGPSNTHNLAAFLAQDLEVELAAAVADMLAISTHAVERLCPPIYTETHAVHVLARRYSAVSSFYWHWLTVNFNLRVTPRAKASA